MLKVKEGEVFKCESCGKEWSLSICLSNTLRFVCGDKFKVEKLGLPHWNGCSHVNELSIVHSWEQ